MANKTVADDIRDMFGPVKRWKEGDIYYGQNNLVKLAYVVFNPAIHEIAGPKLVIHNDIICEVITAEQAKLWDGCECRN